MIKKAYQERKSFVIQMEEEEHKINMQILKRKLELEDLNIKKIKREMEIQEIEAERRLKLLDAQLVRSSMHEIAFDIPNN